MDIRWDEVPDECFEEIVAALQRAMGYRNVVVRTGGADDGWDVDAEWPVVRPDGSRDAERWRTECKRYRGAVPAEKVRDHYHRMVGTGDSPDGVLFATTGALSNPTKEDLQGFAKRHRVRVAWWERARLTELALAHLDAAALRVLLVPHLEGGLPPALLREAAHHQVTTEIERRVGRKYIAALYRGRAVELDLERFLAAELDAPRTAALAAAALDLRPAAQAAGVEAEWAALAEALRLAAPPDEAARLLADFTELLDPEPASGRATRPAGRPRSGATASW